MANPYISGPFRKQSTVKKLLDSIGGGYIVFNQTLIRGRTRRNGYTVYFEPKAKEFLQLDENHMNFPTPKVYAAWQYDRLHPNDAVDFRPLYLADNADTAIQLKDAESSNNRIELLNLLCAGKIRKLEGCTRVEVQDRSWPGILRVKVCDGNLAEQVGWLPVERVAD